MTKIIAFEGIDGTGKSVQMEHLKTNLEDKGFRVLTLSFPVYSSFFGKEIGKLLTGKEGITADRVDQKSMALWFALDRFEVFSGLDLAPYDFILINRYVLSNAVYQSIRDQDLGKPDILEFVVELEHKQFQLPVPDLYLVFDMDPSSASENVGKKGFRDYTGNNKDVYESLPDLQKRARSKYIEYASKLDFVSIIPCMENGRLKSIEEIAELVNDSVDNLLSARE